MMNINFLSQCMLVSMLVLLSDAAAASDDSRQLRGKHHKHHPRVSKNQQRAHKTGKNHPGRKDRGGHHHDQVVSKLNKIHKGGIKNHKDNRGLPHHRTQTEHHKRNMHKTKQHHTTRSVPHHFTQTTHYHPNKKAQRHEFTSRIVGGENTNSGEFKFMVSWNGECGGSLIHDELVLTAAHCGGIDGNGVRIGSDFVGEGGVTRTVVRKIGHPSYNDETTDYDYMILKLDRPVDTSQYPPIQLNDSPSEPVTAEPLTVIGFGATSEGGPSSERLQKVQVPANSHQQCRNQYSGVTQSIHLCAGFQEGGKDSCQGDSGGPIFENRGGTPVQVGVVSFGDGCARPNKSGVYARVSGAYDWIQSQICDLATVNRPASCGPTPPTSPSAPVPAPPVNAPVPAPVASPVASPIAFPTGGGFDDDNFYDDDFSGGYYDDDFSGGYYDDDFGGFDDDFSGGYYDDDYSGFDDDFSGGYYDDDSFWWRR